MSILIISSSLRATRKSHRVPLLLVQRFSQNGLSSEVLDLKDVHLPVFGSVNANDLQSILAPLFEKITRASAVIFTSPEYNGGMAPALKNFIDHTPKTIWARKPIGVATASDGARAGIRAALQLQQQVLALFAYPCPVMLLVPFVDKTIDEQGNIVDEVFTPQIDRFVAEFSWFIEKMNG